LGGRLRVTAHWQLERLAGGAPEFMGSWMFAPKNPEGAGKLTDKKTEVWATNSFSSRKCTYEQRGTCGGGDLPTWQKVPPAKERGGNKGAVGVGGGVVAKMQKTRQTQTERGQSLAWLAINETKPKRGARNHLHFKLDKNRGARIG